MKIHLLNIKRIMLFFLFVMLLVAVTRYFYNSKQRFPTPERADLVYNDSISIDGVME